MPKVQIEMKMPKSCLKCPFQQTMNCGCSYWCGISGFRTDDNTNDKRHPKCPLKEVK